MKLSAKKLRMFKIIIFYRCIIRRIGRVRLGGVLKASLIRKRRTWLLKRSFRRLSSLITIRSLRIICRKRLWGKGRIRGLIISIRFHRCRRIPKSWKSMRWERRWIIWSRRCKNLSWDKIWRVIISDSGRAHLLPLWQPQFLEIQNFLTCNSRLKWRLLREGRIGRVLSIKTLEERSMESTMRMR